MSGYKEMSKEQLLHEKDMLEQKFKEVQAKNLKLDMSRGKPSAAQLNLSNGMMDVLNSNSDMVCESGVDCRNYGVMDGIPEARKLLADMSEVPEKDILNMDEAIALKELGIDDIYELITVAYAYGYIRGRKAK